MNKRNYNFELSRKFLSNKEKQLFNDYLKYNALDENIWGVFESLFQVGTKATRPLLLKVYDGLELAGVVILIKCRKYGRSLFDNSILAKFVDLTAIPFYLWINFGCCMDMMSNPAFIKDIKKRNEILLEIINFLTQNSILTIINDYTKNAFMYHNASILPALPHGVINTSKMTEISDYIAEHKNIKRKANNFKNKGGRFEIINNKVPSDKLNYIKKCFISTSETSVFYLPYQDLYLKSALETSNTHLNEVYYFIAFMNNELLGYQAAVKTGNKLNALHGAFDRTRKTNFHAYDLLFLNMTKFAIDNELKIIDFGAVLNVTKQRMVNQTNDMSYYLLSKYKFVQWLFNYFLKITKIQGTEQMKYRNSTL